MSNMIIGDPFIVYALGKQDATSKVLSEGKVEGRHGVAIPYLFVFINLLTADGESICTNAIIDTGADVCAMSPQIEEKLGLEPIEKLGVSGVISTKASAAYKVSFSMGNSIKIKDALTLVYPNFQELGIDMLIGMNVIRHGDLTVRRDGTFIFEI